MISKLKAYYKAYTVYPKVISIHVPKTAGTSFKRVLTHLYRRSLLPIYHNELNRKIWDREEIVIPSRYRAIQGHFPATPQLLQAFPDARVISWVRHPVQRLISYYHYWQKRPRHNNPNHDRFLDEKPSLIEFSGWDFMQGELSSYFQIPLEHFAYVGIVEDYDASFRKMSEIMGWPAVHQVRTNVGSYAKPDIPVPEREEIEKNLKEDMALYHAILKKFGHPAP